MGGLFEFKKRGELVGTRLCVIEDYDTECRATF